MTLLAALIARSRVGEILLAIRQNEDLVAAVGIAAWKYKLFAFVISAMYAGLGGALYAHFQGFINPEIFGVAQSLDAILAVILGGSGTIAGRPLAPSWWCSCRNCCASRIASGSFSTG